MCFRLSRMNSTVLSSITRPPPQALAFGVLKTCGRYTVQCKMNTTNGKLCTAQELNGSGLTKTQQTVCSHYSPADRTKLKLCCCCGTFFTVQRIQDSWTPKSRDISETAHMLGVSPANAPGLNTKVVFTLGDARSFSGLTLKIPPSGATWNFDADFKKRTAHHPMWKPVPWRSTTFETTSHFLCLSSWRAKLWFWRRHTSQRPPPPSIKTQYVKPGEIEFLHNFTFMRACASLEVLHQVRNFVVLKMLSHLLILRPGCSCHEVWGVNRNFLSHYLLSIKTHSTLIPPHTEQWFLVCGRWRYVLRMCDGVGNCLSLIHTRHVVLCRIRKIRCGPNVQLIVYVSRPTVHCGLVALLLELRSCRLFGRDNLCTWWSGVMTFSSFSLTSLSCINISSVTT